MNQGPRLMVVDDDEVLRPAIIEVLRDSGLEIVGEAADGSAAVREALRIVPDVVVMDMRMPGMTGIEAAELMRIADPLVEVVMLTAYADPALRALAAAAGIGEYVVKGDPLETVLDAIDRAWSRRQAHPAPPDLELSANGAPA
jgi:DNA-binding NarL/FixJ family response regulator